MSTHTPPAEETAPLNESGIARVAALLVSQSGCPASNLDAPAIPVEQHCRNVKPESIERLIGLFRQTMYPQMLPARTDASGNEIATPAVVSSLLEEASSLLTNVMQIAMASREDTRDMSAAGVAAKFFDLLPGIQRSLKTDVQAAYDGDPACKSNDEVILCYPGILAITVYRAAHELYQMDVPLIPRMMTEWAHSETGIDIHPGATIGNHFFIDHGTGVVIGETCIIGEHVKVYQGVTLGALSFPTDERGQLVRNAKRHPTIADNVVIYANSTVLGGKTVVGRDSVIGSSVWLTHSVDPMTTVMMERPKLRLRSGNDSDFEPLLDFQI